MPSHPSLDGRAFASDADVAGGDVGPATVFHYRETPDGVIEARYAGGAVRVGNLVGTRDGDELRFRYAQVRLDGSTATGRCTSVVTRLGDGRLAMDEDWAWESEAGTGTSRVVELLPPPEPPDGIRPIGRVAGGRADVRDDDWAAERATIRLDPLRFTPDSLRGLDAFSHVEVLYRFDRVDPAAVHTGARRPRGNRRGPRSASSPSVRRTARTASGPRSVASWRCAASTSTSTASMPSTAARSSISSRACAASCRAGRSPSPPGPASSCAATGSAPRYDPHVMKIR